VRRPDRIDRHADQIVRPRRTLRKGRELFGPVLDPSVELPSREPAGGTDDACPVCSHDMAAHVRIPMYVGAQPDRPVLACDAPECDCVVFPADE
jgi:hypothetical protein